MPRDKFGNHYEVIPVGSKNSRTFGVQINYKQKDIHGAEKTPSRSNTPVSDIKPNKPGCDGEGLLKSNIVGDQNRVGSTLAAAVEEKPQVYMEARLIAEAEAAAEKCQGGKEMDKEETIGKYEEWFDKPGEVDTLADI